MSAPTSPHQPQDLPDHPDRTREFLTAIYDDRTDLWSHQDMACMLAHQLRAQMSPASAALASLKQVKSRMKRVLTGKAAGIPLDLARALYYVSVAQARVHLGVSISQLTQPQLLSGIQWVRCRQWLTQNIECSTALNQIEQALTVAES